jgi:hypothetical protein
MRLILKLISLLWFSVTTMFSQTTLIESFENETGFKKVVSDGARMEISTVQGIKGKGLKIDYEFTGAGFFGIEIDFVTPLPKDYRFSYYLKGISPKNNLEFKLLDKSGDNVWWHNQRNFEFPESWERIVTRERSVEFAWGPSGGGRLDTLYAIQIIIAAAEGGKGVIHLDELTFEEIVPPSYPGQAPLLAASSSENSAALVLDKNPGTQWKSSGEENQFFLIDFNFKKEFGGLILLWDENNFPVNYDISTSNDNQHWEKIYSIEGADQNKTFIPIKNGEARFIRFDLKRSAGKNGYGLKEVEIQDLNFADDNNFFFKKVRENFSGGFFPKYFNDVQSYWTIIGASEDTKEALINEEGMIEVDKSSFSIEPFLFIDDNFITWNDVKTEQLLLENYLPIPSVIWEKDKIKLTIQTFGEGEENQSSIFVKYKINNNSDKKIDGKFYLAVRPFQVNPPWQFLNITGGVSKIERISSAKNSIKVDNKIIIPFELPENFGAVEFKTGDIINYISKNILPADNEIIDDYGFGSAALQYAIDLQPGDSADFFFIIPFHENSEYLSKKLSSDLYEKKLKETGDFWRQKLNEVEFSLPPSADKLINSLRSNIAYILINKDGPAIQPGSRSYERAWIRDGSLTSSALLRMGIKDEVKEYLDWYSQYQFPSGKVPCVVDKRGADPTDEHDSHGQLIYAILQYFIYSNDTTFLKNRFENISKAVDFIEYLTSLRKTPQYQKEDSLAFYGLVPESISHEGYSAKPMHSYWDDFFIMRGLKDAVTAAYILNRKEDEERFKIIRDDFEKNLYRSINLAMEMHNINYIPGCVELGDFDATSTTIALFPVNELHNLPQPELKNTFDKYYNFFQQRRDGREDWINYTPYEIRTAGTFLYFGEKEKTHEILDYFFDDQRPAGWNHWAEVVWKDIDNPKFIGDMPHTWIGSDYITVVRNMFGYEREGDNALILAAGIKDEWLDSPHGISVKNFPTLFGVLSYSMNKINNFVSVNIEGNIEFPDGGIILNSPINRRISSVTINEKKWDNFTGEIIKIPFLPAAIKISYD